MNMFNHTLSAGLGPSWKAARRDTPGIVLTRKIEFLLLLGAVFFCSMNYFRYGDTNFTVADVLALLCFCFALLNRNIDFQLFGRLSSGLWWLGLTMLVFGLLASSIAGPDPMRGVVIVTQYLYAYLFVVLLFSGRTLDQLVLLAKTYVFSILVLCFQGIYLIHIDGRTNTNFVSGNGRFSGLMERENECAAVIALAVPILLLLITTKRINRVFATFALLILIYGILLTGSNTGLIALVFGMTVFTVIGVNWKRLVVHVALIAGLILAVGTSARDYLPTAFQKRVLGALESGDIGQAGTFDHRVELIYEAMNMTDSTLLLGVGADQYRLASAIHQPVHNLYLLLWTEGGLISAIGLLVMLLSAFGPALVVARVPGGRPFTGCIVASVSMLLLVANAVPHAYSRFWPFPFVLPVALACAYVALARSAKAAPDSVAQPEPVAQPDLRPQAPMARARPGVRR
ncbi:O-antigen ligase family protein [Ensifer adhaerens]|uniref:O-antigen ligase family protein n=1 Tax=Ensifer adhaerens TaxID=106592 RepID=UPI00099005E1|nr:O-antigen ligase family protein [Ensifer adhaerens]